MKKRHLGGSGNHITIISDGENVRIARIESEFRFAFELKNAARVMANQACDATDEESYQLRAFVTGAVILSYSYLEAALNEYIFLNFTADGSPLSESEKAIVTAIATENLRPRGRVNTLQQFNTLLRLLKKPELTVDQQPFRSANLVRSLRNLLVHPVPGRVVTFVENSETNLSDQQTIVKQLRSHLGLERHATFPRDILTSKCAAWAVSSCEMFLREFVIRSGVEPGFATDKIYGNDA
jgi:hypothetical protein